MVADSELVAAFRTRKIAIDRYDRFVFTAGNNFIAFVDTARTQRQCIDILQIPFHGKCRFCRNSHRVCSTQQIHGTFDIQRAVRSKTDYVFCFRSRDASVNIRFRCDHARFIHFSRRERQSCQPVDRQHCCTRCHQ